MSLISFDITYKKRTDNDAFKLFLDSEFTQLKMMICGKYRIFDFSTCYIYLKNELLNFPDNTKLKDIFKQKRVKITVSTEKPIAEKKPFINNKYYCKCTTFARFICDKCNEFICETCSKKTKHNIHSNKIIKIEEYNHYIKNYLHESAKELDDRIVHDEGYQFYNYWNDDLSNEINNINHCYEFAKQELEDIKQIQIDSIIALSDRNRFGYFTSELENLITGYGQIKGKENMMEMIEDKAKLINESNEILKKFAEIKQAVLLYNDTINDIHSFNHSLLKEIKERFINTKKRFNNGIPIQTTSTSSIIINNPNCSDGNNNTTTKNIAGNVNGNLNVLPLNNVHSIKKDNDENNTLLQCPPKVNRSNAKGDTLKSNQVINQTLLNQTLINEKIILKLKDQSKILAFYTHSQTFKERPFIDNSNFKISMTSEADITQLNHGNKLYMLTGNKYNKVFYYEYSTNTVFFLANSLFSHYYGALVYSPDNDSLYLIGGNNTVKCEMLLLSMSNDNNSIMTLSINEWKEIPELNEERQEFGSLCMNNCIYVFFGFSAIKGHNLTSIERYNVDIVDSPFEVIYINEQINLSSIACLVFNDNEILLLGGFDGKNYVDSSLIFNPIEMKIRDSTIVIPNMNKHYQFLFQKESAFIQYDLCQVLFDMKNNAHMISNDSYEVFKELNK